jgi:PAS domain S-box-containing protein
MVRRKIKDSTILEALMATVCSPIYIIDAFTHQILKVNPAAGLQTNISPQQCYKEIHGLDHPCYQEGLPCPLVQLRQTKQKVMVEHVHLDAEGKEHLVRIHGYPIKDKNGEITHFVEYCEDIAIQRQSEEMLFNLANGVSTQSGQTFFTSLANYLTRTLQADYALISELLTDRQTSVQTLAVSHNGKLIPNFEYDLVGTPCENVVQKSLSLYPRDVNRQFPEDHMLMDLGIQGYAGIPLRDSKGGTLGLITVMFCRPIEQEKQIRSILKVFAVRAEGEMERQQRERELAKLAAVVEQSTEAVVLMDVNWKIRYINSSVTHILGYQLDEIDGMGIRIFAADEDAMQIRQEILQQMSMGQPWSGRRIIKRKDSGQVVCRLTIFPLHDEEHKPMGFASIFADISEQASLEERLRQTHKMEALGQFASGIAHDFNNLIMVIQGTSELVQNSLKPDDPLADDLAIIKRASLRAAELSRDLLAFSRRQVLQFQNVDLHRFVEESLPLLRRLIPENIVLEHLVLPGTVTVRADRSQLQQVLMNLCSNARDAMPDGGQLSITTKSLYVNEPFVNQHPWAKIGWYGCIQVQDTGVGIQPEILGQIFEPFFTTKEVGRGTGLGLATVFGIIKQHDGMIDVTSLPSRGTSLLVFLPVVGQLAVPEEERRKTQHAGGAERILLVEDQTDLRLIIHRLLINLGYSVEQVSTGEQARRLLLKPAQSYDLIISDMVMPGLSGADLARTVRSHFPHMAVLLISGYTPRDPNLNILLQDPQVGYLSKPFGLDDLATKIRELLDCAVS